MVKAIRLVCLAIVTVTTGAPGRGTPSDSNTTMVGHRLALRPGQWSCLVDPLQALL